MFQFKQFAVDDSHCGMKVGTDAVTLGAWAEMESPLTVLDVGAGSGILSLIVAQRYPNASVTAIEIDENAAEDCRENFAKSPFSDRLALIVGDFLGCDFGERRFDMIISNPPFFTEALKSPEKERATARHEGEFGIPTLIEHASRLLSDGGRLVFVAPTSRDQEIRFLLTLHRLWPAAVTRMRQRQSRPLVRTLWNCCRSTGSAKTVENELTVNANDGGFTAEYAALTRDFYLAL